MQYLKADTVTEVTIGPVVSVGDGFTPVTTLSIASADEAEIIKHAATTTTAITGTLAAITGADGYYALDLVTGDVDTEGRLTILINDDSLCLPVRADFMVVNANVYDSLFAAAATDYLQTDATQFAGQTITAGAGVTIPSSIASPTNITAGTITTVTNLTNAATNGDLTATMKASVIAEADTALTDYDAPTNTEMVATFTEIKGATWASSTDTLEAIRDRGDAAWTTGAGGSDRLLMVDTTIATLSSQTSFTLTAGSADDDAYNNCTIVIEDVATATQKAVGVVSDYTGATKTVTLKYDPAIFTMAATDKVYILAENALKSAASNRQLDVAADGKVQGVVLTDTVTTNIDLVTAAAIRTEIDSNSTQLAAIVEDTGTTLQAELDAIQAAVITNAAGVDIAADIIAIKAETANILTDTGTTIPATITTAQNDLDTITGTDGVTLATSQANYAPAKVSDLGTVQTGDTYALASGATGFAAIDTVVDAIKAKTDNLPEGIQKNTALTNFEFLMTDDTNHAPSTGLTVTATRSIDGAAFGACANAVSEVASGIYKINLAAADLNGDVITLRFTATSSDDRLITIVTNA